jgi:hypothetical protein
MTTALVRTAAQILADETRRRRFPGPKPRRSGLLTSIRAARLLGVSAVTLARMSREGLIVRHRFGSGYYYDPADVDSLLAVNT